MIQFYQGIMAFVQVELGFHEGSSFPANFKPMKLVGPLIPRAWPREHPDHVPEQETRSQIFPQEPVSDDCVF
jgi:hypothetical protein